jgi:dipeptidyl-peptidase 9
MLFWRPLDEAQWATRVAEAAASRSWLAAREVAGLLRTEQRRLAPGAPAAATVLRDGARLLALAAATPGGPQALAAVDLDRPGLAGLAPVRFVATGGDPGGAGAGPAAAAAAAGAAPLSREEELLRERQRQTRTGITSFAADPRSQTVLYPQGGSLWVTRLHDRREEGGDGGVDADEPREIPAAAPGARLDPQLRPGDATWASFVRGGHVFAVHLPSGLERQLSSTQLPAGLTAGSPPYVVQEEFDRYSGVWWAPSADAETGAIDLNCRVLMEIVDERNVREILIPALTPLDHAGPEGFRFPRVGAVNPSADLALAQWCKSNLSPCDVGSFLPATLPYSLQVLFPWHEYLVRAGWINAELIWFQLLDRTQTRLELVVMAASCFGAGDPICDPLVYVQRNCHVVRQESAPSDSWINIHDSLRWLPGCTWSSLRFLWTTEASGFRHILLCSSQYSGALVSSPQQTHVALTSGSWAVDPGSLQVVWMPPAAPEATAASSFQVYFNGFYTSPLERHLYNIVVSGVPTEPGAAFKDIHVSAPHQLTLPGSSHAVTLFAEHQMFLSTSSSLSKSPHTDLYCMHTSPDFPPVLLMHLHKAIGTG